MNIPVRILRRAAHPSLNDTVYKVADFRAQAILYDVLQCTINEPENGFLEQISQIKTQLEDLESATITQTKLTRKADLAKKVSISPSVAMNKKKQDVISGKVIPGIASDPISIGN